MLNRWRNLAELGRLTGRHALVAETGDCLLPFAETGAADDGQVNPGFCRHGNPNLLTADRPSSTLSQGCTGQLALVEIEPHHGIPPELSVTRPLATA